MDSIALILYLAFLSLAFLLRTFLHWLRTGSSGVRLPAGRSFGERAASALFVAAVVIGFAAVLAESAGLSALHFEPPRWVWSVGLVTSGTGLIGTLLAQAAMGASWRIGVDPAERTELVTTGVYRISRNPIFTFMLVFAIGLVLMVPGPLSLLSLALLFLGIDLQVRIVEEPYLSRTHGEAYESYRRHVGRYLPRLS